MNEICDIDFILFDLIYLKNNTNNDGNKKIIFKICYHNTTSQYEIYKTYTDIYEIIEEVRYMKNSRIIGKISLSAEDITFLFVDFINKNYYYFSDFKNV